MATVTTTTTTTTTTATTPAMSDPPPALAAGLARWTPSIPTNLISMLNPFAVVSDSVQKTDKAAPETAEHAATSRGLKKRPVLKPLTGGGLASRESSPARSTATSAMFDEPDTRSTSEEGSVDGKERLRRSIRPKTRYSICQAPPASSTRQKLHRRPRALLQLHKLSSTARPRPAYEVIPSANFSVRLTRAISKVFTARHSLCQSDLVVLRAENYNGEEEDEDEEMRDVIGLICKGRKDDERNGGSRARIYLASGREWEAYTTMGGAYEFLTTDEHGLGLTVRWVPKRSKDAAKATGGRDGARKFNFSTISPNSRRHPVIATLSKTGLDINDTYKMPDPAAATPLSTPQQAGSALAEAMEEEGERELCETDDQLREIITITSIWVAFREGWSPAFKYDDKDGFLTPASPTKSLASAAGTPPASPGQFNMEKRRSIQSISSGIIRRTSVLSKRNSSMSTTADDDNDSHVQGPAASAPGGGSVRSSRARADSSSTVLVHRAASNRRKNQQHPQQRKGLDDLLAAHNQLQEVSREELPTRDGGGGGSSNILPRQQQSPIASSDDGSRSPTPALLSAADAQRAEKRESTATTDTSGFLEPPTQQNGKQKRVRKSGSWRRLLCGSSQEQV